MEWEKRSMNKAHELYSFLGVQNKLKMQCGLYTFTTTKGGSKWRWRKKKSMKKARNEILAYLFYNNVAYIVHKNFEMDNIS